MTRIFIKNFFSVLILLQIINLPTRALAAESENQTNDMVADAQISSAVGESGFREIEWDDLLPADDLEALSNPPEFLSEIEDGSPEDVATFNIITPIDDEIQKQQYDRFQMALISTQIIEELDGQSVRIPGFVVPLEYDDDQVITEFFLVPYFGACIHVPPPPPNQIIYVKYEKGLKLDVLYDPFWISGVINTELINNEMATAAYTMKASALEPYTE